MIWFRKYSLQELNQNSKNTLLEQIGIELIEVGDNFLSGKMPVDKRTYRPRGILHGGASVVLAESVGSLAAWMCVDPEKLETVGMEVNANHIRRVKEGYVYGKAIPLHIGKRTHIWEIKITNEEKKLVCISRLTMAIVPKF